MTVQVGDIYESTDSRRPKRVIVDWIFSQSLDRTTPYTTLATRREIAQCRTKHPKDSRYKGYTEIRLDRLTPKCHWRKVRSGK